MTPQDLFILCVGVCAVKSQLTGRQASECLGAASKLPEDVLGDAPPHQAAHEFVGWYALRLDPKRRPAWLKAYDDAMADRAVVRVNPDSLAHTWWTNAEVAFEESSLGGGPLLPESCRPLVVQEGVMLVEVTKVEAAQFRAWVENVPGCEEQPFLFEEPAASRKP